MKNFLRRFTAAVFIICIVIGMFGGCTQKPKTVMEISGARVSEEIFTYYLDRIVAAPENYDLTEKSSEKEFTDEATYQCKKYVAANTLFARYKLTLTPAEKTEVAQTVNNLWIRYGNHYDKIGVSRSTLTKIQTANAYEDKLFAYLFDKGTDSEEGEKELKDYFYSNYVLYRAICGYFTATDLTGAEIPMNEAQRAELVASFNAMKNQINSGATLDSVAESAGLNAASATLLKSTDTGYPEGFFATTSAIEAGKCDIIEYNDTIFLIYKEDLKQFESAYYVNYRSTCLKDLYYENLRQSFDTEISGYTADINKSVLNAITDKIEILG